MDDSKIYEIKCFGCSRIDEYDNFSLAARLRKDGKLRREIEPDSEMLLEVAKSSLAKTSCSACGFVGLSIEEVDFDDAGWGGSKLCEHCKKPIDPDRLEVFPETKACMACQSKLDRGESLTDDREFCPKCGNVLSMTTSSRSGISKYVISCSGCNYRSG